MYFSMSCRRSFLNYGRIACGSSSFAGRGESQVAICIRKRTFSSTTAGWRGYLACKRLISSRNASKRRSSCGSYPRICITNLRPYTLAAVCRNIQKFLLGRLHCHRHFLTCVQIVGSPTRGGLAAAALRPSGLVEPLVVSAAIPAPAAGARGCDSCCRPGIAPCTPNEG